MMCIRSGNQIKSGLILSIVSSHDSRLCMRSTVLAVRRTAHIVLVSKGYIFKENE